MTSEKLPAIQFYTMDWLTDPAVRSISIAARGLWIDLLCLMSRSERRGYLIHKTGKPMTHRQIARISGESDDVVYKLLQEMEDVEVYSRDADGIIYSRRMVRDEEERAKKRVAGMKGGRVRVANEREQRRTSVTSENFRATKEADFVWQSIEKTARKNKVTSCLAADEAINRLMKTKKFQSREAAAEHISSKFNAYLSSEEGQSDYRRHLPRWLDEDAYDEDPVVWSTSGKGF